MNEGNIEPILDETLNQFQFASTPFSIQALHFQTYQTTFSKALDI